MEQTFITINDRIYKITTREANAIQDAYNKLIDERSQENERSYLLKLAAIELRQKPIGICAGLHDYPTSNR